MGADYVVYDVQVSGGGRTLGRSGWSIGKYPHSGEGGKSDKSEPFAIVSLVLPEFNDEGELPPGVHVAGWQEFQARFGDAPSRRVWLSRRLRALLVLAATTGKLRRVFIWGSFVTAKPAPKDSTFS